MYFDRIRGCSLVASIERIRDVDSRIDDWDVMTATRVQVREKCLPLRVTESDGIVVKVSILVHVIYIRPTLSSAAPNCGNGVKDVPNVFKWNAESLVVVNHFLQHGPIRIAPATLVEPKCEVLLHSWKANSAF